MIAKFFKEYTGIFLIVCSAIFLGWLISIPIILVIQDYKEDLPVIIVEEI
jgi:hypothetical protein